MNQDILHEDQEEMLKVVDNKALLFEVFSSLVEFLVQLSYCHNKLIHFCSLMFVKWELN